MMKIPKKAPTNSTCQYLMLCLSQSRRPTISWDCRMWQFDLIKAALHLCSWFPYFSNLAFSRYQRTTNSYAQTRKSMAIIPKTIIYDPCPKVMLLGTPYLPKLLIEPCVLLIHVWVIYARPSVVIQLCIVFIVQYQN